VNKAEQYAVEWSFLKFGYLVSSHILAAQYQWQHLVCKVAILLFSHQMDQPLMSLHAKYASRSELLLQNDIWRSVIVLANYSLFQLHMVLLEVFQLIESKETTHGFRPAKAIYPEHGIKRFQLVHPEMIAQGWMKEIAHGVYIGN
jgi:hypothetical protein